jgi:hypothetical protein
MTLGDGPCGGGARPSSFSGRFSSLGRDVLDEGDDIALGLWTGAEVGQHWTRPLLNEVTGEKDSLDC